jgi:phosphatidylinositol dimannoside acyltransferase
VVSAYRVGAFIAPRLPRRVAETGSAGLSRVLQRSMRSRVDTVGRHQQRLGTVEKGRALTSSELDHRVDAAFASYARYWVDSFRLIGLDTAGFGREIEIDGLEHVEAASAAGRGVVAVMPHIGAWDLGGAWLASRYPLTVVAERVEPAALFDWFVDMRRENGMEVVALGDPGTGGALLNRLRSGGVVGLLCDRDITGDGIEIDFFGERTTMAAGPATLALRTGATILPTAVYQRPGQRSLGVIRPPIVVERAGRLRDDVATVTQLIAHELETLILAAPEQWHVFQPNWPSDLLEL